GAEPDHKNSGYGKNSDYPFHWSLLLFNIRHDLPKGNTEVRRKCGAQICLTINNQKYKVKSPKFSQEG
ncbi:MAG: hypothetical protein KKD59_09465, partial [Acidobacteria bacterium]|nr:hypothetical protein [Acidobacteriota bacterium]